MIYILLLLLHLIHVSSANAPVKQLVNPTVCPTSGGGLYIVLNQVPYLSASTLCLSAGLGLANLTFSNNFVASQLLVQCGAGLGWISSFERVRSNTCVVLTGDGNVYFPDSIACNTQLNAVICQDFAATLTDTATSTATRCTTSTETDTVISVSKTTLTRTTTTTSTAPGGKRCPGCVNTRSVFIPGGVTTLTVVVAGTSTYTYMNKAIPIKLAPVTSTHVVALRSTELVIPVKDDGDKKLAPWSPDYSNDCPSTAMATCPDGDFVLLKTHLPFKHAECACRRAGMKLANIDQHSILAASSALFRCFGEAGKSAWVKSWNGDDYSHACLSLTAGGTINVHDCGSDLAVLCERSAAPPNIFLDQSTHANSTAQQQLPVYSLCSTTQSNLFIVYSQSYLANQDAFAACQTFNLQPANIYDNTRAAAAAIFSICSAGDLQAVAAQVNAFDGLQGAACNLVDDTQAVLIVDNSNGQVAQNCFQQQKYFVCQGQSPPSPSPVTVFTGPFFFVTTVTDTTVSVTTFYRTTLVTVVSSSTVLTTEVELISLSLTTLTSTTTTTVKITSILTSTSTSQTTSSSTSASTSQTTASAPTAPAGVCPAKALERCPIKSNSLVLLASPVPFAQADCACRVQGLALAELSIDSFTEAAALEFNCLGPYQKAWIKPYQPDSCQALYVGKSAEGAAALPLYCQTAAPVLCQK